jgi:hypothetical protein
MDETAAEILSALRLGSVPSVGVAELAVGREAELEEFESLLEFVRQGKSALKFISGDFGSGKSFISALLRERAFDKGFAASTVVVSPDSPLWRLEVLVGKTFDGLRLPTKRTACALSDLLEKWLFNLLKKTATLEGLKIQDPKEFVKIIARGMEKIGQELSAVRGLDASFGNAIKTYLIAKMQRDYSLASDALGWLKGGWNLPSARKSKLGIKGDLSPKVALNYIKGLLTLLRDTEMSGLVWIIDEVETVQRLPSSRLRENSYETLRKLVDEVAENTLYGLMLIITGTPALFEDPRFGIPSYEALIRRIKSLPFPNGKRSFRQPILVLSGFDFNLLLQVAAKVREIHGRAFAWNPQERLTEDHIKCLAEKKASALGGLVEPGDVLREIVNLLDMLHDHPNLNAEEYMAVDR